MKIITKDWRGSYLCVNKTLPSYIKKKKICAQLLQHIYKYMVIFNRIGIWVKTSFEMTQFSEKNITQEL